MKNALTPPLNFYWPHLRCFWPQLIYIEFERKIPEVPVNLCGRHNLRLIAISEKLAPQSIPANMNVSRLTLIT